MLKSYITICIFIRFYFNWLFNPYGSMILDTILILSQIKNIMNKLFPRHLDKKVGDIINVNGIDQILWPRHCVQDTFGADFPNNLNHEKINKVIFKGTNKDIDSYSGFYDNAKGATTHLSEYLKSKGIEKVDCVGLATEYCVKYTAIDASKEGFSTRVKLKYTKGLNQNDINQAIEEMRSNKIVMI